MFGFEIIFVRLAFILTIYDLAMRIRPIIHSSNAQLIVVHYGGNVYIWRGQFTCQFVRGFSARSEAWM